jgi:glutamyl-tRNA synthetase
MSVVVRFPPSPTGKMHVGNARTALFNWLYAGHTGGQFKFRVEDTDAARSTPENVAFITEALAWLGLPNHPEFLQSSRIEAHQAAAKKLLAKGKAYTDAEGVLRFNVKASAEITVYDAYTNQTTILKGQEAVDASKLPQFVHWKDLVQDRISINLSEIEDFALLRSDGTPTYHLSVVCDDAFQGVTHVVRGDDHLSNTPKHILLFQALGYTVPTFAHLPLILGTDGAKLSKRHGAASVQDLRAAGYLPQAVFNYLIRLGWGHGDQEIFSVNEAIAAFDVANVSPGPARFDADKLNWLNQHYLKTLPLAEVWPHFIAVCGPLEPEATRRVQTMWPQLTQRAHTLLEVRAAAAPLLTDVTQTWAGNLELVEVLLYAHMPLHWHYDALSAVTDWTVPVLEAVVKNTVAQHGGDFKTVGRPLRVALTAQLGGPSVAEFLAALGQTESLRRLKAALHFGHHHGAAHG